jgi:hypothetical protein
MSKLPNLSHEATIFARNTQQELAQLRKAMKSAEDGVAGLDRAIKDPALRVRRHTIKKSTSSPSFFAAFGASVLGGFLGSEIDGGSFYQSAAQKGARLSASSLLGQRIS